MQALAFRALQLKNPSVTPSCRPLVIVAARKKADVIEVEAIPKKEKTKSSKKEAPVESAVESTSKPSSQEADEEAVPKKKRQSKKKEAPVESAVESTSKPSSQEADEEAVPKKKRQSKKKEAPVESADEEAVPKKKRQSKKKEAPVDTTPRINWSVLYSTAKATDPEAAKTTDPEAAKATDPEAAKAIKATDPEAAKATDPEAAKATDPEAAKAIKATDPEAAKATDTEAAPTPAPAPNAFQSALATASATERRVLRRTTNTGTESVETNAYITGDLSPEVRARIEALYGISLADLRAQHPDVTLLRALELADPPVAPNYGALGAGEMQTWAVVTREGMEKKVGAYLETQHLYLPPILGRGGEKLPRFIKSSVVEKKQEYFNPLTEKKAVKSIKMDIAGSMTGGVLLVDCILDNALYEVIRGSPVVVGFGHTEHIGLHSVPKPIPENFRTVIADFHATDFGPEISEELADTRRVLRDRTDYVDEDAAGREARRVVDKARQSADYKKRQFRERGVDYGREDRADRDMRRRAVDVDTELDSRWYTGDAEPREPHGGLADFRDKAKALLDRQRGGEGEDRPSRSSYGDRPKRDFSDRPPRNFGGEGEGEGERRPFRRDFDADRPPRRDFDADRPTRRDFDADRPRRDFRDRPPRNFDEEGADRRPRRDFDADRPPRRDFDADRRPRRDFDVDRPPRRDFDVDRPPRRENRSFGGEGEGERRPARREFTADRPPRRDFFDGADRPRRDAIDRPPRSDREFGAQPPRRRTYSNEGDRDRPAASGNWFGADDAAPAPIIFDDLDSFEVGSHSLDRQPRAKRAPRAAPEPVERQWSPDV